MDQIRDKRVHADNAQREAPGHKSLHVYNPMEQGEQQQAESAGNQHKARRGDVLHDVAAGKHEYDANSAYDAVDDKVGESDAGRAAYRRDAKENG